MGDDIEEEKMDNPCDRLRKCMDMLLCSETCGSELSTSKSAFLLAKRFSWRNAASSLRT